MLALKSFIHATAWTTMSRQACHGRESVSSTMRLMSKVQPGLCRHHWQITRLAVSLDSNVGMGRHIH